MTMDMNDEDFDASWDAEIRDEERKANRSDWSPTECDFHSKEWWLMKCDVPIDDINEMGNPQRWNKYNELIGYNLLNRLIPMIENKVVRAEYVLKRTVRPINRTRGVKAAFDRRYEQMIKGKAADPAPTAPQGGAPAPVTPEKPSKVPDTPTMPIPEPPMVEMPTDEATQTKTNEPTKTVRVAQPGQITVPGNVDAAGPSKRKR
jgi:hypothetical protein